MSNNITQKLKNKESVVKYSYKYGVTKAAIRYNECGRTIYRWRERYDGSIKSLESKSRKPHSYPNQHTEELKLIRNYKANNKKTGLVVLWVKLRNAGYTRKIQGLYLVLQRMEIYEKASSKKKKSEAKEWITWKYPGDKIQVDVKYVLSKCMTEELKAKGERFYYNKVFYSLEDLRNRGKEYNNFSMRTSGWLSPNEFLKNIKVKENRY